MALKAKSSDTNEFSDDEDSEMKSYITRQFKKFMKNSSGKGFDKDHTGWPLRSSVMWNLVMKSFPQSLMKLIRLLEH